MSGSGFSETYFNKYLKQFVNKNFKETYVVKLPCNNENYIIDNKDNNENNCIFIVGGDGTVSMTIQNIMINSKFDNLNIPIYICPFGSGNGLAKNLNVDPYKLSLNGKKKYINSMEIQSDNLDNKLNISFLSQTWGIISDIDINTEFLRCIGDFRFYYGILKYIFLPNFYKGSLDITTIDNNDYTINGDFYLFCASNAQWISSDFKIANKANIFSKDIDILIIKEKISLSERIKLIYYLLNERIDELDFVEYFKVNKYNLKLTDTDSMIVNDGEVINSANINVKNTGKQFLFYSF
tara:strand:+ start:1519 stop:2403 length:885 start_codon:yes stop_codon:yes gene_type:complete